MTLIAFKLKERRHGSTVCVESTVATSLDLLKKREDVIKQQSSQQLVTSRKQCSSDMLLRARLFFLTMSRTLPVF